MYSGPSSSVKQNQEDYLLGRKKVILTPYSQDMFGNQLPSLTQSEPEISPVFSNKFDMESKAREDPLFAIKKKELDYIKKTVARKTNISNSDASKTASSRTLKGNCSKIQKQHRK
jgi:hypothetical protein